MPSNMTVDIQQILHLRDETVFKKSHDGKYIDLICCHITPKDSERNEAFNLRIISIENKNFTIQLHWDYGEIIDEYAVKNANDSQAIIHGLYDGYMTSRTRHLNTTITVRSRESELYECVTSTCDDFIPILQHIFQLIELEFVLQLNDIEIDKTQRESFRRQCISVMHGIRPRMDLVFRMTARGNLHWKRNVQFYTDYGNHLINALETKLDLVVHNVIIDNAQVPWILEHLMFNFRQAMQSVYVENFCSDN
jgi:hypothetical protein